MVDEHNELDATGPSNLRHNAFKLMDEIFAEASDPAFAQFPFFQKARIDPTWNGTMRPALVFDGETSNSTRTYAWMRPYTPAPGDVVLVVRLHHGWVILDKIVGL